MVIYGAYCGASVYLDVFQPVDYFWILHTIYPFKYTTAPPILVYRGWP